MTRLILITIIGVVVLVLLFEVSRDQERNETTGLYYELVHEILEAQPQQEGLRWRLGPLSTPGAKGGTADHIILTPSEVDWRRGIAAEGRQLPEPPPVPPVPSMPHAENMQVMPMAFGYIQTDWILMRNADLGDHKLSSAVINGMAVTRNMASLGQGRVAQLHLYQCYSVPFTVYRYRCEVSVPPNSRYPLGRRMIEVGLPWVEWGEPMERSATTCRAILVPESEDYRNKLPQGEFEVPVRE